MTIRASLFILAFSVAIVGCGNGGGTSTNLDNIENQSVLEQASYLFGYQIGDGALAQMDSVVLADLDMDIMLAAIREALEGDSLRYEPESVRRISRVIDDTLLLRGLRREAAEDTSAQNFLDEIATNTVATDSFFTSLEGTEGLQSTESGLRYVVLQEGEGDPPAEGDIAQVKITTTLMGGQEVRGMTTAPDQPAPLVVGSFAVEGLTEALKNMAPGESRRLFIPPGLAFGIGGLPAPGDDRIPPATAVIMEVELVDVLDQEDTSMFNGDGTAPPAGTPVPTPTPVPEQ